MLAKPGTVFMQ